MTDRGDSPRAHWRVAPSFSESTGQREVHSSLGESVAMSAQTTKMIAELKL